MNFVVPHHEVVTKTKVDHSKLPKIDMKDWAKTKERIVDHFTGIFGADGIPLAYILRETSQVKEEEEDRVPSNCPSRPTKPLDHPTGTD